MMKRKNDPNKLMMIAAGTFVGVMLILSIALYFLGSTTAQAEAQNLDATTTNGYTLEALDTHQEDVEVNLPISMTSPSDEITLDMAMLDNVGDLETQQVPEPSIMAVLSIGGLALLRRRRRTAK